MLLIVDYIYTELFQEGVKYIHSVLALKFRLLFKIPPCFGMLNHIKRPFRLIMNSYFIILTFLSSPQSLSAPHRFTSELMISSALCKFYFLWQEKLALFSSSSRCLAGAHSSRELSSCTYLLSHNHLCFHPFLGRADNPFGETSADVRTPPLPLPGWMATPGELCYSQDPVVMCLPLWVLEDILSSQS